MQLNDEAVKDFQKKYYKHTGKKLSVGEAREQAMKAIELLQLIYRPIKKKDLEERQKEVAELSEYYYGEGGVIDQRLKQKK